MNRISMKERIKQGLFLLDGAMGTELIARGVKAGKCSDYLNIESPDVVLDIHRAYLQAGSDAVLTNTFGANKYALGRHGLGEMVEKINNTAAQIARKAAGEQKYVLGDIGPTGDFLQPVGSLEPDELEDAFTTQAKALVAGGVDGLIIETMTALDEVIIAIEAAKSVCSDLPVFASMAFDKSRDGFRTMMGVDVESAVSTIVSLGVDAIGFNCGTLNMEQYVKLAQAYVSEIKGKAALLAEPNAGKPELVDGKAVYNVRPQEFAAAAEKIHLAGVNIIGGCCGTGPAHIEATVKRLK